MITTISWLELRAFVAVALGIGCLLVFLAVAFYLQNEIRMSPHGWRGRVGNRAALAILLFMFGETLNRGWGAVLTVAYMRGFDIGILESNYPIAFFGAMVAFLGIIAKLRIFSPDRWGEWLWIYGALIAIGGAGLIVWI